MTAIRLPSQFHETACFVVEVELSVSSSTIFKKKKQLSFAHKCSSIKLPKLPVKPFSASLKQDTN